MMKLNKFAGLGIASIVLFGSVGELAINAQPAEALKVRQANTAKAELLNVNFRHRRRRRFRRSFKRNFRHHGRRRFRHNSRRNFIYHQRRNRRNNLKLDRALTSGYRYNEKVIRVRLF